MTVTEIGVQVTRLSYQTPSDAFTIAMVNDAMENLALEFNNAKKRNSTTVACTDASDWSDLPADCIGVYRVDDSEGNEIANYTIKDGVLINLPSVATYTIRYYTFQTSVTLVGNTPGIHVAYHNALAYWVAYKFISQKDPSNPRASQMLDGYTDRAMRANATILGSKTRRRRFARSNDTY